MKSSSPLERACGLIRKKNLDALLVTSRENCRYFSGFTGSDSTLLIAADKGGQYFFCDSRYTEQAAQESPGWQVIEYKRVVDTVAKRIRDMKLMKVGFESRHLSYNMYHRYLEALDAAVLVPVERQIDLLRVSKSKPEIEKIKKAVQIAEAAFEETLPSLNAGVREDEWALNLEFAIRRGGSGPLPFDIIVASGVRGAMPHGKPAGKPIRKGELVTVDFGASFEGYHCDTTITVALGTPPREVEGIYHVVLDAHDMAIESARPGMELKELDAVARKYIDKKGYARYFGHGLGHGVGLAVHEEPSLSPLSEGVLEEGAVVTIEPGIYIPGKAGVRIEDMILVTSDGAELLTTLPKGLRVL